MWPRFTTKKEKVTKMKQPCKTLNLNEEYLCAVRTKSFADFFVKVQILENSSSSSEVLLDPGQETITSLLESSDHHLKPLLFNYFDISAEASSFCSELLKSLNKLQDDHRSIYKVINAINGHDSSASMIAELRSRIILDDAFSVLNKQYFSCIHEKHSSVLQQLNSNRKRVARKIKMIKFFNKASGVCVTAACGIVAAAAVFLAIHTVAAIVMGPLILTLPIKQLKKKFRNFGFMKYGFLRRVVEQLDVAAKGAYILNRDFDTMGRLVARLQDEIKHRKTMIQLCMQRMEDRFCLQVLKELNKYEFGFIKQVEELEEHVYLCLVTINRARALVVKEINLQ